jgi:hypothetical protein
LHIRLLYQHHEERTEERTRRGVHDLSARVRPADLLARGRDEVTGYGGEIIANEEDDL